MVWGVFFAGRVGDSAAQHSCSVSDKCRPLVIVESAVAGSSVRAWADDKLTGTNTFDANPLTNGVITFRQVSVSNPLPLATLNQARANAVTYTVSVAIIIVLAFSWFGRSYATGFNSRRERALVKKQRSIPSSGRR